MLNISMNPNEHYQPGQALSFGMTLIGNSIEFLSYFVYAFILMGKGGIGKRRGKFQVRCIDVIDEKGNKKQSIYENGKIIQPETILGFENAVSLSRSFQTGPITIIFSTPRRIKFEGRYQDVPEFHVLIRNLIRPMSNLLYFHCNRKIEFPFHDLIERAQLIRMINNQTRWFDWIRYSNCQNSRMNMGGIIGQAK